MEVPDSRAEWSAPAVYASLPPTPEPRETRFLKFVFLGPNGLRAGWRLLIYFAIVLMIGAVLHSLSPHFGGRSGPERPAPMIAFELIGFVSCSLAAFVMSKIEREQWSHYGLPPLRIFSVDFALGLTWGFVGLSAVMLCLWLFGAFQIEGFALHGAAIFKYAAMWGFGFLLVGLFEEFLFRGYLQYTLASGMGFWPAAFLGSALFFVAHRGNPGETWAGLADVFIIGLFFCFTWWRTGDLWFAVGLHAAWDWGLSFFYSVPDSGVPAAGHLLRVHLEGPRWLTGGSAGPEGSVINLLFDLLCFVVFAFIYTHRKFVGMNDRRRQAEAEDASALTTAADPLPQSRVFNPAQAHRLEDPERLKWMPPQELIRLLRLEPGMVVADVGAGTGFFALPLAKTVTPGGKILAVDLQPEMLEKLSAKLADTGVEDIELSQGSAAETKLPERICDVELIANVWHEIEDHSSVLREAARILKPGGTLAILDWRPDMDRPPGPPLEHRVTLERVRETVAGAGWSIEYCDNFGRYSYLVIARLQA